MLSEFWNGMLSAPVATGLVMLVALAHLYFLRVEMFLWETPRVIERFGQTPETARLTRDLAANQGLYNGFLAAGLLWAAARDVTGAGFAVAVFFLGCVLVAGLYGGRTLRLIYVVQALPAALGLAAVLAGA